MRVFIRNIIFNSFALWLTSQILPGLDISDGWQKLLAAGLILCILMFLVKPILKILLLPLNFLTFGILTWFINVFLIYLLSILVPDVTVKSWVFNGISTYGLSIAPLKITYFFALVLSALMITTIVKVLEQLCE